MWVRGWGGRIRTSAWRNQNPLPYRLATPQQMSLARPNYMVPWRCARAGEEHDGGATRLPTAPSKGGERIDRETGEREIVRLMAPTPAALVHTR